VQRLRVSTLVYLPPEEVYDFLIDFPRYAKYSEYLEEVRRDGDDSPGTEYDLQFAWWKLTYTARSTVTGVDRPERIDWKLIKDIDASGYWEVIPEPESAPEDEDDASRVQFVVEYAPDSAESDAIDLPAFASIDWLIEKVTPKIQAEAKQVVRRVVRDLEGQRREVTLEVHEAPSL